MFLVQRLITLRSSCECSEGFELEILLKKDFLDSQIRSKLVKNCSKPLNFILRILKSLSRKLSEGCGEQKMRKFASAISSKRFIDATNQTTEDQDRRFQNTIDQTYQEVMQLQTKAGSFNLWGTRDVRDFMKKVKKNNSRDYFDLTAYIVKILGQYETLNPGFDKSAIDKAMKFIARKQESDGKFENTGKPQFRDLQKFSSIPGVSLTAFVLIGILESEYLSKNHKSIVDKGLKFLDSKYSDILSTGNNYEKSLTFYLYVLAKKNHQELLDRIRELSVSEDDKIYWNLKKEKQSSSTIQVEISAYVALALLKIGNYEEAKPIISFLMSKRNPEGGFASTTDTVIGLQALTEFSKIFYSKDTNMEFKVKNQELDEVWMTVSHQKRLANAKLSSKTRQIEITSSGVGFASVLVSCSYFDDVKSVQEHFELTINARKVEGGFLKLEICARTKEDKNTNMAIMEVGLPSGYEHKSYDSDLDSIQVDFLRFF